MLDLDPGLMIWAWVTFFVLLFSLYKVAWKPILSTIDKREQTIKDSIDRAEKAKEEAESLLEKHNQLMLKAEEESQKMIKENRELANKSRQEILEQAKESADKILSKAKAEIEKEKDDALYSLRAEVADLAIAATKKIIGESMDESKQKSIVTEFIQKMPKSSQN
jgi:F-type H+-transporting ATPase subunit b